VSVPEPGIYEDVAEPVYRAWDAASYSSLKILARSRQEYRYWKDNPREETDALRLGSAFDHLIFEPELYQQMYAVAPEVNKRTKEGKETLAQFEEEHPNQTYISKSEEFQLYSMQYALSKNWYADQMLRNNEMKSQVAFVWHDEETNVLCKSRVDMLLPNMLADLKTSRDVRKFKYDAFGYSYHIQAAMYLAGAHAHGIDVNDFRFIVIDKNPPHIVKVFNFDDNGIKLGQVHYRSALYEWRNAHETNNWEDEDFVETIQTPMWRLKEEGIESD